MLPITPITLLSHSYHSYSLLSHYYHSYHTPITLLSHSYHTPITLLSYSYHTPITPTHSDHTPITPITLLSHSYHTPITRPKRSKNHIFGEKKTWNPNVDRFWILWYIWLRLIHTRWDQLKFSKLEADRPRKSKNFTFQLGSFSNFSILEVRGANAPLLLAPAEGFEDSLPYCSTLLLDCLILITLMIVCLIALHYYLIVLHLYHINSVYNTDD